MLTMLLAYNAAGEVIATLGTLLLVDADGQVQGQIDLEAAELAGMELIGAWNVEGAAGSGTWPECIGGRAHDFSVELAPSGVRPKIVALVHKVSGHRRERSVIEEATEPLLVALANADGTEARETVRSALVAVLGGPGRALLLDDTGRTLARPEPPERPSLPLIGAKPSETL